MKAKLLRFLDSIVAAISVGLVVAGIYYGLVRR